MPARRLAAVVTTVASVVLSVSLQAAPASAGSSAGGTAARATGYAQLVSQDKARGVAPKAEKLGVVHKDPLPEHLVGAPTDTDTLYDRAGLEPSVANAEMPTAGVPAGEPALAGLTTHVTPSCTGTGSDGNRVQALYVREASTPSRYEEVLPLLRNEIATVDDVFSMSARKTGGDLKVRWVHDNCVPVIPEVVVPDGTLGTALWPLSDALKAQGFDAADRKYLSFSDANEVCGIASLYADDSAAANLNDGVRASFARVDSGCWSGPTSIPAHELSHMLGAVQATAPHATANGHCTDEADLMCYVDGAGVEMSQICSLADDALLDCRNDDYFHTNPAAGSYLDTHWNTARSSFLDDVAGQHVVPRLSLTASAGRVESGDRVTVVAESEATNLTWGAPSGCSLSASTGPEVHLTCLAEAAGDVDVVATATDTEGYSVRASVTVSVVRAAAPDVAIEAPAVVKPGSTFPAAALADGKPAFTYDWTVSGGCTLTDPTSAHPEVSCHKRIKGDQVLAVVTTQADGQTATDSFVTTIRRK